MFLVRMMALKFVLKLDQKLFQSKITTTEQIRSTISNARRDYECNIFIL